MLRFLLSLKLTIGFFLCHILFTLVIGDLIVFSLSFIPFCLSYLFTVAYYRISKDRIIKEYQKEFFSRTPLIDIERVEKEKDILRDFLPDDIIDNVLNKYLVQKRKIIPKLPLYLHKKEMDSTIRGFFYYCRGYSMIVSPVLFLSWMTFE